MAAISIPVPEEQENPPGNPDLKICTNKNCMLCNEDGSDEFNLGKLYEFKGIVAHYYCLLLSSNMQQRGDDTEGIFGFLPVDIRKEIARGRNLRCYYCKMKGATIGCCSNRCKRVFHLPCGRKKDSLHQFFAEFRSYCGDHRPLLNVKNLEIPHDSVCNICLEVFKPKPSKSTIHSLLAFCCKKWFHRVCIQRCALNSGYFFKCPMCNNKTLFQRVMQDHGIFIPEQDAAWELEPGAYRELLDRHNQCDARVCVCPKGRNFNSAGTRWAVVLCSSCGSQGMHVRCGKLGFRSPAWECPVCVSAHSQHGQPAHGVDAAQSNSEAIIEIEDSDDDDVQLISVSMGNQDTESAIVCIDDEEGSPLQLIKSDTLLATPGGGAISVMTIAASDKIQEVVGDLNVVHQRRMPDPSQPTQPSQPSQPSQHSQPTQPSQPSLKIVSVVGGVQISDDDDDSDVVVESGPSELPGSRSAAGSPPCKRLRTAGTPPVPHAAAPPVSLSLGITSQMQNMIIVSPASSSQGQQPHPEQLPASPSQQPVAGKNQNQMGHISFPVPGMDRAGGVINLQVMFPPGGMINLVQTPFPANSSQMPQVPTFQLFQGMFPNTSLPVSPQMSPSVPVSSALASTVSSPVSKEVPRSSLLSQQTCSITTTSSPQTASETTVSAPEPSPLPAEKTRQASSSPAPAQAADDDVQFVSEYPSDISTRMLLTPDRDSPLRRLPHSAPESDAGTDVASRNTPDQSDVCGEQSFQPQGCALGQCINTNRNIRLVQNDASPGTSSSPRSACSGQIGGAARGRVLADQGHPAEAPGLPETPPTAGPSGRQRRRSSGHRSPWFESSGNNRTQLIPAFIPLSDLKFSHQSDSSLKVVVKEEFVVHVTKSSSCLHKKPIRHRYQNLRYITETRKYSGPSYRPRQSSTHSAARSSNCVSLSSSVIGERQVMRPISDPKNSSASVTGADKSGAESSEDKRQQGDLDSADIPTSSVDSSKPSVSGGGQENISPGKACDGLNVMIEKLDHDVFRNESAVNVDSFRIKGIRQYGKRKRKYSRFRLSTYSHRRKCQ